MSTAGNAPVMPQDLIDKERHQQALAAISQPVEISWKSAFKIAVAFAVTAAAIALFAGCVTLMFSSPGP